MNITVIYASNRKTKSCTYNIAQLLIKELLADGRLFEFFLPKDMPHVCCGCYACIRGHEKICGGYAALAPILSAMEQSELLIFCSPTYALHTPGQMKTLLDHLSYRFMVHRPDLSFMKKQAVIINTAGGGGMRATVREIKDSTQYWGVARTYSIMQSVWEYDWTTLPENFRKAVFCKASKTIAKIRRQEKHLRPSMKVKGLFYLYRWLHGHRKMSAVDDAYWAEKGYV